MTTVFIGKRGGGHHKEKVDAVAHGKRRELQVIRAEGQACARRTEVLCREMFKVRAELDAAVREYDRRKDELAGRQTAAHNRLAQALENRSAAELSRETVRDQAENDLKAQRTAGTVRAYRLDTRWRLLHGRYRGFVADVLNDEEPSEGHQLRRLSADDEVAAAPGRRQPPRAGGRRFFAVADKFSVQHRRESLRTSRSLHAILSGYLKETSDEGSCGKGVAASHGPSRRRRSLRGTAALDGVKPEQVLDKLRVMQEQCARIAERVRRRNAATDDAVSNDDGPGDRSTRSSRTNGGPQAEMLSEAHEKLAAGLEYLRTIRALKDRAAEAVQRERVALRGLLRTACGAVCAAGNKPAAQPNDSSSYTVVEIAGRLERACFTLFARLDKASGPSGGSGGTAGRDVVALCLRAVQTQRADAIRQARDVARRVDDFHKATARLLSAAAPTKRAGAAGRGRARRPAMPPGKRHAATSSGEIQSAAPRTLTSVRRTPPLACKVTGKTQTVPSAVSPPANGFAVQEAATTDRDVPTIKMLCPPIIGIIEYE
ncbi:Hypothetical protein CINCED_3A018968 [Cinara cedri]|uniref:Uncharacterized protein n=1 Tax=Cinara cedri TaxID=506608 RepID=A0A5E4MV87_9HEMI|nr:Hypothetical protein CINCED_3A018968 [Cinara cedri]